MFVFFPPHELYRKCRIFSWGSLVTENFHGEFDLKMAFKICKKTFLRAQYDCVAENYFLRERLKTYLALPVFNPMHSSISALAANTLIIRPTKTVAVVLEFFFRIFVRIFPGRDCGGRVGFGQEGNLHDRDLLRPGTPVIRRMRLRVAKPVA